MNLNELSKDELIKIIEDNEIVSGKFGLVWDKEKEPEQIVEDCHKKIAVIKYEKEKSVERNGINHLLFEGDNFFTHGQLMRHFLLIVGIPNLDLCLFLRYFINYPLLCIMHSSIVAVFLGVIYIFVHCFLIVVVLA